MSKDKSLSKDKKRLGELLVEAGFIDDLQLAVALGQQKQWGGKLGSELIRMGFIEERELAHVLQKQLGIKWISLHEMNISPEVLSTVPRELAVKYNVIPVAFDGKTISIATTNPSDLETMDALSFSLGKRVRPVMALEYEIKSSIARHYDNEELKKKNFTMHAEEILKARTFASSSSKADPLIRRDPAPPPQAPQAPQARRNDLQLDARKTASVPIVARLEALVDLLVESGLITREALEDKLRNL